MASRPECLPTFMRTARFTTLDLFFATTLVALVVGLFTSAWQWNPVWLLIDERPPNNGTAVLNHSTHELVWRESLYIDATPAAARVVPPAFFIFGFAAWSAAWGIVRKRGRESFAVVNQRL